LLKLETYSSVLLVSLESSNNARAYLCDIPPENDLLLLKVVPI